MSHDGIVMWAISSRPRLSHAAFRALTTFAMLANDVGRSPLVPFEAALAENNHMDETEFRAAMFELKARGLIKETDDGYVQLLKIPEEFL